VKKVLRNCEVYTWLWYNNKCKGGGAMGQRYDFIIYTDYDGKKKAGLVPRKRKEKKNA
jgi:hypothetical protein